MSNEKLQDFGEHIAGAKKETYFRAIDPTSEEVKKLPLSKLWTDKDIKDIENINIRAVAFVLKDGMPNKPRNHYKLSHWLETLNKHQNTVIDLLQKNELSYTNSQIDKISNSSAKNKAYLLPNITFDDWKRIGKVAFYQSAGDNGIRLSVQIDNKEYSFTPKEPVTLINFDYKKIIDELADEINNTLKQEIIQTNNPKQITARSFDIYTRRKDNTAFICAKTDRQKTPLIEFATLKEAREYKKDPENIAELSRRWTAHREHNSITKADMRNSINEERTGQSYRDHDITPDEFMATFGIRGGQFGNWVTGDERQQMLNATYDGFMDLSKALNIEPKAIGLNGTLGIAFGARGSGNASAHYERGEQVINLTKTRGAGSLAHEWWHALDHYMKNGDDLLTRHLNTNSTARHQELIAPVHELVKDIHKSELYNRSQKADAYRNKPYFVTDVEMTARAFEGHIQHTLSKMGIKNDFLVNIKAEKDWQKNLDAYPYPKAKELEPLGKAYNAVFDTLKEVDKEFVPVHYEPEQIIHADTLAVDEVEKTKETRTEWGDFPPVISNGKLRELSKETEMYKKAKNGDFEQSAILIDKFLREDTIQDIKEMIGDEKPIIVPILSEEATGKNRIPQAFAYALASQLNLQVDTNIRQINKAKRTDSGIYHRYVSQPEFGGEVRANQSYLIVDDTLSVGGTIANLKGYIENNGGKVIGASVMTAYEQKTAIAIKADMLQSISEKDGLNDFWIKKFGFGLDKLTQQEAGHLKKPTLEQIQTNVQEAQQKLLINEQEYSNEQQSPNNQLRQSELHQTSAIDTAGVGGTGRLQQTGGAVFSSLPPSQKTNQITTPTPNVSTQNTYINCPYAEKDHAKALGAKWDNVNKSWYVPAGLDLNKFGKWLTPQQEKTAQSQKVALTPQGKTYLYTTPKDNEAIQKLKADGLVKFDVSHKVWYTLEPDNPQVKQWLHPAHIPSAEEAFAEHLRANGISIDNGHPIADGRPHRLSNDGSNDKNVMYQLYRNDGGIPAGRITNFSRGGTPEKWVYPREYIAILKNIEAVDTAKGLTPKIPQHSQNIQTNAKYEPQQKPAPTITPEQRAMYDKTAQRVQMVMSFAQLANQHEYLDRKQVTHNHIMRIVPDKSQLPPQFANDIVIANDWREAQALRNQGDERMILQKGNLMIPQFNEQGELRSFETIGYQGAKYALKGGEKNGLSVTLGQAKNGEPIIIAEGYATGATLHEQTGRTVVVAFGKGGLLNVAQQLREHCPDSKIYIGADNDHAKTLEINPNTGKPHENVGLVDAQKVAEAVPNTHVLAPQFNAGDKGKDWNDVYVDKGIDEFKRQIKEQLNRINPPKEQPNITQSEPTLKERLDSDFIKQSYPQMSDENLKAIQVWKEVITHSEKYAPKTKKDLLKRLADHIPSYANGERLPLPTSYMEQQNDMGKQIPPTQPELSRQEIYHNNKIGGDDKGGR